MKQYMLSLLVFATCFSFQPTLARAGRWIWKKDKTETVKEKPVSEPVTEKQTYHKRKWEMRKQNGNQQRVAQQTQKIEENKTVEVAAAPKRVKRVSIDQDKRRESDTVIRQESVQSTKSVARESVAKSRARRRIRPVTNATADVEASKITTTEMETRAGVPPVPESMVNAEMMSPENQEVQSSGSILSPTSSSLEELLNPQPWWRQLYDRSILNQ